MDNATIGLIAAGVVGMLTALTAWFKLFRASRFIEGRIAYMENQTKAFVTSDKITERVKLCENRFNASDETVKEALEKLRMDVAALDGSSRCYDRDITRLQEALKSVDAIKIKIDDLSTLRAEVLDKFTKRGDFIREMQIITSQLRLVQEKIDHIDVKLDERLNRK